MPITQPTYPISTANFLTHAGGYTDQEATKLKPRVVVAGNLGSSYGLDINSDWDVWLVGTLTANITITVTELIAGSRSQLLLVQDATGGRTVTISDGTTSTVVPVDPLPGSTSMIDLHSPNGTDLYVVPRFAADAIGGLGATFVVAAYNASAFVKSMANYVCDGTADEVEINAVITALPAFGGKVLLSEGEFKLNAPVRVNRDNVTLEGMGSGVPIAGSNPDSPTVGGTRFTVRSVFSGSHVIRCAQDTPIRALHGVYLRHFGMEGFSGPADVSGIYHQVTWGGCEDIFGTYLKGDGFYSTAYDEPPEGGALVGTHAPFDCFFDRMRFRANEGHGMVFDEVSTDHIFNSCIIDMNAGDGIRLQGALGVSAGCQLHACYIYSNDGCGLRANTWQLKLYDTRIQDNGTGGIYLTGGAGDGAAFQIVGGNNRNNSIAATNTYDGINIAPTGNVYGGLISGVDFCLDTGLDNAAHTKMRYGINVANAFMNDLVIGPNSHSRKTATAPVFGTGYINDQGTGTKIMDPRAMKLALAHPKPTTLNEMIALQATLGITVP